MVQCVIGSILHGGPIGNYIGVRCSSVVRAFAHGAMCHQIDPSWWTHWQLHRSEMQQSLMVRCIIGSILHGPLSYLLSQPVLHNWCNKGHGMCYPVCGMMHIKEPLLLIEKSSLCCGSGFPLSLSEWSFTICLMPYNHN